MKNRYYYLKDINGNLKISPLNKKFPMLWKSGKKAENYAKKHCIDFVVYEVVL